MLLTLRTIRKRLRHSSLPAEYDIKPPEKLTRNMLMRTMSLFQDTDQLIYFIVKLCPHNFRVSYENDNVELGGIEKFIHIYSSGGLYPELLSKNMQEAVITYFQKQKFTQSQLMYMIHNLSRDQIRDLLLSADCFALDDLLAICNLHDILDKLEREKIKLLYHYLTPTRCWLKSRTPLLDLHYFSYRAGHVLGVTRNIVVSNGQQEYRFKTSGDYNENSMKILVQKLHMYHCSRPSGLFHSIYLLMKQCHGQLQLASNTYKKGADQFFYDCYQTDKQVYLSTGWVGHTVGVALYGHFLVFVNRGEHGDHVFGVKIYLIPDKSKIDLKFFTMLTNTTQSHREFISTLGQIVPLASPLVKLRCQGQKRGDCTFSNPKAMVMALIILFQVSPTATISELMTVVRAEISKSKYKAFTKFIRDREIDELVKNMFYASTDLVVNFFVALVKAYIKEHHGSTKKISKDRIEKTRAYELYHRCPELIKAELKKDDVFMSLIKALKQFVMRDDNAMHFRSKARIMTFRGKENMHEVLVKKGYIKSIDGVNVPKMFYTYHRAKRMALRI